MHIGLKSTPNPVALLRRNARLLAIIPDIAVETGHDETEKRVHTADELCRIMMRKVVSSGSDVFRRAGIARVAVVCRVIYCNLNMRCSRSRWGWC